MKFQVEKITKQNGEEYYSLYKYPDKFVGLGDLPHNIQKPELLVKGLMSIEEAEGYTKSYLGRQVASVTTVKTFEI